MNFRNLIFNIIVLIIFTSNGWSQTTEELKRQKQEEQARKLKLAKQESLKDVIAWGYHGGTMAPFGIAFYTMTPDKVGFYGSLRFARDPEEANKPWKALNLNLGITKNLFFPVAGYMAGGISSYDYLTKKAIISPYAPEDKFDDHPEIGFDASAGLIFHVKGFELQTGISLFNFQHPEFCFGIAFNLLKGMK